VLATFAITIGLCWSFAEPLNAQEQNEASAGDPDPSSNATAHIEGEYIVVLKENPLLPNHADASIVRVAQKQNDAANLVDQAATRSSIPTPLP